MPWYYTLVDVNSQQAMGPVEDAVFLQETRDGKHSLNTPVNHNTITKGQWYELQNVRVLKEAFYIGQEQREKLAAQKHQEEQKELERLANERKQEQERLAFERQQQTLLREQQSKARHEESLRQTQQQEHSRQQERFHAETRSVFDRYWMPDYLKVVWILNVVLCMVVVAGWWMIFLFSIIVTANHNDAFLTTALIGFVYCCGVTVVALPYLVATRISLELFAVIFDIRGLLKKQEVLLQTQNQILQPNVGSN